MHDWIHHLNGKTWATYEVMDDFIEILLKLLRLELPLYSSGKKSRRLPTGDAMREMIANHVAELESFKKKGAIEDVTSEDWQSLLGMEKDDLARSSADD